MTEKYEYTDLLTNKPVVVKVKTRLPKVSWQERSGYRLCTVGEPGCGTCKHFQLRTFLNEAVFKRPDYRMKCDKAGITNSTATDVSLNSRCKFYREHGEKDGPLNAD